jgi:transcriptional accessory protein Tex/SPT6
VTWASPRCATSSPSSTNRVDIHDSKARRKAKKQRRKKEQGRSRLAGVITNVTAFGAFVDVGVHQDGLVHVSELAHRFVKDPAEVAKAGDKVKVKVIKLDRERRRIGLSMKQAAEPPRPSAATPAAAAPRSGRAPAQKAPTPPKPPAQSPFNSIRIRPPR